MITVIHVTLGFIFSRPSRSRGSLTNLTFCASAERARSVLVFLPFTVGTFMTWTYFADRTHRMIIQQTSPRSDIRPVESLGLKFVRGRY